MSELTSCNYCKLKRIKASAKKDGKKVTQLRDSTWGMGGVNVYVHHPKIVISDIPGGGDGDRSKYRMAWMMEISKSCCC